MGNYNGVDLEFGDDGDYVLNETGDLKDTSDDFLQWLRQEILTRVRANLGDWNIYPEIGAGLDDFIGEPNTQSTAADLSLRIREALTFDNLISISDLEIRIVPVSIHRILISIEVLTAIDKNTDTLRVALLFDSTEKNLKVL